ncbi:unnamed protein product, partial [Effrenium voratum]
MPESALSRSASEGRVSEDRAARKLDLRRRAKEIVALNSLYAQSSSGSLQHAALPRIRRVLEAQEELLAEQADQNLGNIRDKHWARDRLRREKAYAAQLPAPEVGKKWVLRRGTWFYEGGPEPEKLPADEAMDKFVKEEEARGRGPRWENGIAKAGLMRRWNQRNPFGGFFD